MGNVNKPHISSGAPIEGPTAKKKWVAPKLVPLGSIRQDETADDVTIALLLEKASALLKSKRQNS